MSEARNQMSAAGGTGKAHSAKSIAYLRLQVVLCPMRFALCYLLITIFLFFPVLSIADKQIEDEKKKKQIEQIELDLNREKEKFLKFDVKEKNILEQLSQIEKSITGKRTILNEIAGNLKNKKTELKIHRKKLDKIETSLAHIESLLGQRLTAFYKNAKRGYLKVLLASDDLDLLNHNMKYLRVIMDEDKNVMTALAQEKSNYNREMSIVQEQLDAIARLEGEEKNKISDLKQDMETKVLLLAKIHREKEFYEIAVKELQSAANYLKDTISGLENRKKQGKVLLPSGFGRSKGKLPFPVKGKVIKNTRKKGERSFDTHKGIYIKGSFGSEVKAVYPGRVDFSGKLKGYGQVIVINHGDRYFTISAYLLERNINEGDAVIPGEVIGFVGESGLVTGPSLYFEIRRGEKNLNPLKWLKVN